MVRRFIYILLSLAVALSAVSCLEEMEVAQPKPEGSDETILVPRVKSFTNQYITKAYATNETKITNLALLVFNNDGALVHLTETSNAAGVSSITLNKSMLDSPSQKGKLSPATLVVFANVDLEDIKYGETAVALGVSLSDFLAKYSVYLDDSKTIITSIGGDFPGFPMMGTTTADLSATRSRQEAIAVPLQILYAKINFNIFVAEGTENQGTGSFELSSYSVNNASMVTSVTAPEGATASATYYYTSTPFSGEASGTVNYESTEPVKFTFYISESRYQHNNSDLTGIYPDDSWATSGHYDDLLQQYKPKLVTASGSPNDGSTTGLASYVTLTGTYTDYRGATWDVNYKVYLGKDNYQNFEVDRNSEYTNNITIKGIRNNDSYDEEDQVWFDHRVSVDGASGAAEHVTITRETLIDSHIEVRPLRVSWPEDEYVGVRVYLPTESDGSLVDWIGIERFTGANCVEGATYCYANNKSTGKRKYFTTSLISELQSKEGEFGVMDDSGVKYIYLLNGECAWIYFDENSGTSQREAKIKLEFYPSSGNTTTEEYNIKQSGLQTIGNYVVESYEEYLHSYDSADKYNLSTSPADYTQQGLSWGYTNTAISQDIIVSSTPLSIFVDYTDERYDYFHASDVLSGTYYSYIEKDGDWEDAGYGSGLIFTDRASTNGGLTVKDMGSVPDNAYQYCLSKNKFNEDADGNHTLDIHWYLPDVHELADVLGSNSDAKDFSDDAYYWSSQPSYTTRLAVVDEVAENARAVSKSGTSDIERTKSNRIRCFFSAAGITADMSNRVPDGVGGNYTFYMKAWNGSSVAYFNYLLPDISESDGSSSTKYANQSYAYPTFDNPGTEFGYFSGVVDENNASVEGFSKNPASPSNWTPYTYDTDYYTTLATFPGLSAFTLEQYSFLGQTANAYSPTTTEKSETKVEITKSSKVKTFDLPSESLNTLDYLTNGDMFNVTFSNNINTTYSPKFDYSAVLSGSKQVTTTRYWQVPTYTEDTYTPKAESDTENFEGKGTATVKGTSGFYSEAKASAKESARETALANAKQAAADKYPNRSYTYGTASYSDNETYKSNGYTIFGTYIETSRDYTCVSTCTIEITCTATATPITYYQNATNGGWDSGTSETVNLDGVETDELKMYCGNSLTISLADAYKSTHEITKVKIHTGSIYVAEKGGFLGIGKDKIYARFVDDQLTMPQDTTIAKGGSSETLQLQGMDYNEDVDADACTHQWTGEGRESVTLALADYFVNDNISSYSYTYMYDNASTDLTKYVIIDKIEVKCTPKSTTGQ